MGFNKVYTLDEAVVIARSCIKAQADWGQSADLPYHQWQLVAVMKLLLENAHFDSPSREEYIKLQRQYSLVLAREARAKGHAASEVSVGSKP